ncbi:MAG TPA: hypothetical protein VMB84_12730 [Stellaceae bacterium]|nr:hypothetical protein [Stellaceae bacterium]
MSKDRLAGAAAAALALVALCSCAPPRPQYPAARQPLGLREALRPGHWRGPVGMTEVDYTIEQVLPTTVTVRVSGTVLHQANRSYDSSSPQNYFYDRPRACKITADRRSFDCTRYSDMHIDNGLLCGVYAAPDRAYRPCLEPVP